LKMYEAEHGEKMLKSTFGGFKGVINCVIKYCQNPRNLVSLDKSLMAFSIHDADYSRFLRLPVKNSKKAIKKAYQPADVNRLVEALSKRVQANRNYVEVINALAILCSINTGMRIAELCALKWSDIYDSIINIHAQIVLSERGWVYEGSTKDERYCSAGGREFPLTNQLRNIFEQAKHYQEFWGVKTEFVFGRAETWSTPSNIGHALAKISKKLNLTCTNNHALRMYFNSYVLAARGVDPSTRAYLLGHSVQVNLDVYTLPLNGNDLCQNVLSILNEEQVTQKDSLVTQQKTA
ncbi:MAG: tyrosine-type recombinase/integrase, partial [Prevotella sp.]